MDALKDKSLSLLKSAVPACVHSGGGMCFSSLLSPTADNPPRSPAGQTGCAIKPSLLVGAAHDTAPLFYITIFLIAALMNYCFADGPSPYLVVNFKDVETSADCPVQEMEGMFAHISSNFNNGVYFLKLKYSTEDMYYWEYIDDSITSTAIFYIRGGCQFPAVIANGFTISIGENCNDTGFGCAVAQSIYDSNTIYGAHYFLIQDLPLSDGQIRVYQASNGIQTPWASLGFWSGGFGGSVSITEMPVCLGTCISDIGNCWRHEIIPEDDCSRFDLNFDETVNLEDLSILLYCEWMGGE